MVGLTEMLKQLTQRISKNIYMHHRYVQQIKIKHWFLNAFNKEFLELIIVSVCLSLCTVHFCTNVCINYVQTAFLQLSLSNTRNDELRYQIQPGVLLCPSVCLTIVRLTRSFKRSPPVSLFLSHSISLCHSLLLSLPHSFSLTQSLSIFLSRSLSLSETPTFNSRNWYRSSTKDISRMLLHNPTVLTPWQFTPDHVYINIHLCSYYILIYASV